MSDTSWIYFVGSAFFWILFFVSGYFTFKFRKTKIPSKDEMMAHKRLKGKNPSMWVTHRFAYGIMVTLVLGIIAIITLLGGFGIYAGGNPIT